MNDSNQCSSPSDSIPDEIMNSRVENWGWTNMSVLKFNFLWIITNFSYCQEKMGETIKSPVFSSTDNDREKWCLRISPRGPDEESKDHISLYLLLVSCNKPEVTAKFRFSAINDKGEEIKVMESPKAYKFVYGKDWGFKRFIKRDFLFDENNDVSNDKLTIFCEISIILDPLSVFGKNDETQFKIPTVSCKLMDDLEQLFLTRKFCDVTISANGQKLMAHKAILAARSPVFSAMFEHDMAEGQSNNVIITDIDDEVLNEMLRFIYTGKVKNLEKMAFNLLAAADKYDLGKLKTMCEEVLSKNLNVGNVVDILTLSDLHSAAKLKSMAIIYLTAHARDVMVTESWEAMVVSHPHLVAEAFKFVMSQETFLPPSCKRKKYQ